MQILSLVPALDLWVKAPPGPFRHLRLITKPPYTDSWEAKGLSSWALLGSKCYRPLLVQVQDSGKEH